VLEAPAHNLGAAHLELSDDAGDLPLIRGDSVLSQRRVDFIKKWIWRGWRFGC
jgi:hypothetical protein